MDHTQNGSTQTQQASSSWRDVVMYILRTQGFAGFIACALLAGGWDFLSNKWPSYMDKEREERRHLEDRVGGWVKDLSSAVLAHAQATAKQAEAMQSLASEIRRDIDRERRRLAQPPGASSSEKAPEPATKEIST